MAIIHSNTPEADDDYKLAYFKAMKGLVPEIPDEVYTVLSTQLLVKHYNRKELIFRANEVQQHVGYVLKGLIRAVYIDAAGNERTTWFTDAGEYATDYPCFLNQQPSCYAFEVLEEAIVVLLPKNAMDEAYEEFPAVQKYGRLIAEYIIGIQHKRIEDMVFKTAKQRYLDFTKSNTSLLSRISQAQLASYLGIERQSLVRIRKELLYQD
jgi:CRP-like cAMP-binding protein